MSQLSTDLELLYPQHLAKVQETYQKAVKKAGKEGLLIAAGSLKYAFLDDHSYPFKVNPHFKAWLPVTDLENCFVLIKGDDKPQLLFNQPEDYWHKPAEDPSGFWVDEWQIQPIGSLKDAHNRLGDTSTLAFIGEETELARTWGIDSVNDERMLNHLHYQRAYKTPYELACLQMANNRAVDGHRAAETAFRQGRSEFEIQQAYLAAIAHREHQAPYSGIVALNEHCAVLHYQHYEQVQHSQDKLHSLLIDAGADQNGYGADITRTYAYRRGRFGELIEAMDEAQLSIIEDIEIGMNYADLNQKMHLRLARLLKDFELVDMAPESMLETNITFTFLPHGLGHFLGLQTHDVAGFQQSERGDTQSAPEKYPALRLTRTIENGQVFTIEPGLYFIPMLLDQLRQSAHSKHINWRLVESLLPCGGIRIEDNIAIVNDETINMTREAFA